MDLALNNLQRLICRKTQQTKPNQTKFIHNLKQIQLVGRVFANGPEDMDSIPSRVIPKT